MLRGKIEALHCGDRGGQGPWRRVRSGSYRSRLVLAEGPGLGLEGGLRNILSGGGLCLLASEEGKKRREEKEKNKRSVLFSLLLFDKEGKEGGRRLSGERLRVRLQGKGLKPKEIDEIMRQVEGDCGRYMNRWCRISQGD